LGNNSGDHVFPRSARSDSRGAGEGSRRKSSRARAPSSAGYLIIAGAIAVALFFALWWMLVSGGDEAPWVPAGLAASVVLLVALSAREAVMRRAWTRYLLEQDKHEHSSNRKSVSSKNMHSASLHSAALRTIQKQSAEADSAGSTESHLEVFHTCQDYLTSTDEALRSSNLTTESKLAIRGGQEKVRSLQKHHMLIWARDGSRALTHEAQQRARMSDKIETANRALDCLDSAMKVYPDEPELEQSRLAIREFIASVKVAHWVELAERSAFKGHYRRAIERYQDALFYLDRETVKEELRAAGAERIGREIELLRAQVRAANKNGTGESSVKKRSAPTPDEE
jgi:tetratricopeptide (TPR) repeat protein